MLRLYRLRGSQDPSAPKWKFQDLEAGFWADEEWKSDENEWRRRELCVINIEKKELKFKVPEDLMKWISRS